MNGKLRKTAVFLIILLCAAGIFGAGMAFGAGSGEPGSQQDPIVTLSYLESRLSALENNSGTSRGGSDSRAAQGFEKRTLDKGQKLSLSDGAMVIVSAGNGKIGGDNGLLNLSTGEMFGNGTSAVLFSVFMATDGSGSVTALGNMTVYVCGSHEIG